VKRSITSVTTALLVAAALGAGPAAAASAARPGPYFSAPFTVRENSHTFGQTPSWTRYGRVLSQKVDRSGIRQVYRSRLDGSKMRCVTCGKQRGPNGFPEERPQGDWILFSSYGNQPQHIGGPGLGGYGGDLYVIRHDGSRVTRLTKASDPNDGARYDMPGGVPYDNYHPYWSPNGRRLVWTRTRAYPLAQGGQKWEMMLADFVAPRRGRPRLANVRVVGPAFGVYETQHWAPDGSGFLFTAFGPRRSPYQATDPGWMHQQLYFMRLYGRGASPANPRVTLLTDDTPAYQEQAIFTPDMKSVIFMSNRNSADGSWYNLVSAAAKRTGFDAPYPGSTGTLQFLADFSDPNFRSDLFMVDVRTRALRQLTDFHNVIPEFHWNRTYTKLLWSGIVGGRNHNFITRVGRFPTIAARWRRTPRGVPAPGLYGRRMDMRRVAPQARSVALARRAQGTPVEINGNDKQAVPPVVLSYLSLWQQQLKQLGDAAGMDLSAPVLFSLGD
jgi:Tol biopolymer transport system component